MHIAPHRKLYRFRATTESGKTVRVAHGAYSQEEAEAIARAWGHHELEIQSVERLRGNQLPEVALQAAMEDPVVGPEWLPHLWAIPASTAFVPGKRHEVMIRFARDGQDFTNPQPRIRVQPVSNGAVYVGVGPADLLTTIDPGVAEMLQQLGWSGPIKRIFPDFHRRFGPSWNLTYCLHRAIQILSLTTDVGPHHWFTIGRGSLRTLEPFHSFERTQQGKLELFRVPPEGIAPGVEVHAAEEPVFHIPQTAETPQSARGEHRSQVTASSGSSNRSTTLTTVSTTPSTESENTTMNEVQNSPENSPQDSPENTNTAAHQYTALLFIVDRSGSMSAIRDDMVGGLSTLLEEQKVLPGRLSVDLLLFDHTLEFTHEMADPDNVEITLEPRGRTALHDALGVGINYFAHRVEALSEPEAPTAIQVVVVTDGEENASSEYSAEQVRELITGKQADPRWDFVFLGANQDAVTAGGNLGFHQDASMTFSPRGSEVRRTTRSMSRYMHDRRSGQRQGFTEEERSRSTREER